MSAPLTTTSGAWSPPMPSSARTTFSVLIAAPGLGRRSLLLGRRAVGQDRHVLAVEAAMRAHRMRPLQLAAILALDIGHRRQRVMRAPHVAAGLRNLLLGNCHDDLQRGGPARPPQKTAAALQRRGRRLSLYKTSRRCNNLAPAARLVSKRGEAREGMPALLGRPLAAFATRFGQDI